MRQRLQSGKVGLPQSRRVAIVALLPVELCKPRRNPVKVLAHLSPGCIAQGEPDEMKVAIARQHIGWNIEHSIRAVRTRVDCSFVVIYRTKLRIVHAGLRMKSWRSRIRAVHYDNAVIVIRILHVQRLASLPCAVKTTTPRAG